MPSPLNILLVDDHPLFRNGLKNLINTTEFSTATLFEASNGNEALKIVLHNVIDVIFLDVNMPEMNGFETAEAILGHDPAMPVIILTQYDEIPLILNFFKLGARGFLTKNIEENEISEALINVLRGDYYYHTRFDNVVGRWLEDGMHKSIPSVRFSPREMQLLILMSKGKTTNEIGTMLELSARSIESYRSNILKKAKVKNAAELISYMYKNSIL